jgi:RNA recognition motif-containing protein
MENPDDADRTVKYLNRTTLEGRVITVEKVSSNLNKSAGELNFSHCERSTNSNLLLL